MRTGESDFSTAGEGVFSAGFNFSPELSRRSVSEKTSAGKLVLLGPSKSVLDRAYPCFCVKGTLREQRRCTHLNWSGSDLYGIVHALSVDVNSSQSFPSEISGD